MDKLFRGIICVFIYFSLDRYSAINACDCNEQADTCDEELGRCFCRTMGVVGDTCDTCDTDRKYVGNPKNGGTCYYHLVTDYLVTFNFSKPEQSHFTEINFMNTPRENDVDVRLDMICIGEAWLNISFKSKSRKEEKLIMHSVACDSFSTTFEYRKFGPLENTTLFVYVYSFQTPFWIQISFAQTHKLDLVLYFGVCISCFFSFVIILAGLYKLKGKYNNYRHRQVYFFGLWILIFTQTGAIESKIYDKSDDFGFPIVNFPWIDGDVPPCYGIYINIIIKTKHMSSRPFVAITIDIDNQTEHETTDDIEKSKERNDRRYKISSKPSHVTLEPLHGQRAAVLTLFVQLPGDEDLKQQLVIASTLVKFRSPEKQSVEQIIGSKKSLSQQNKEYIVLIDHV